MRSPSLTRDEWILLLDLFLRRRPRSVAANDPELLEISAVLSRRPGIPKGAEDHWRSPDGLRARLSVFRGLDSTVDTSDTKRAALGQAVWNTYAADPAGCAEAAQAIREMFGDTRPHEARGSTRMNGPCFSISSCRTAIARSRANTRVLSASAT